MNVIQNFLPVEIRQEMCRTGGVVTTGKTNLALVNDGVNPLQVWHLWDLDEGNLLGHTP